MRLAIGERYRHLLGAPLKCLGAEVLWLPDNKTLDPRLSGHADLSVYCENGRIYAAEGVASLIVNSLTNDRVFTVTGQAKTYPKDAGLCVCPVGQYLICNPKTAEPEILRHTSRTVIPVHQGYTRCSVCVVSDDSIITSDSAIACKAEEHGLDVLRIASGYIALDGFDYGFIGGASINISETVLAFTGTLDKHPNKSLILDFLQKHGKKPVFLTNNPIFDIGGGIALP